MEKEEEKRRKIEAVRVKDLDERLRAWSGARDIEALVAEFERVHGSSAASAWLAWARRRAESLRSSAIGEDSRQASFAGQYRTHLGVRPELIGHQYKGIVAGKYRSEAIVYRQQRGYRHQDVLMCAGCLAMVDAAASGVVSSRPPDDPRSPWVVVHAARLLLEAPCAQAVALRAPGRVADETRRAGLL